MKSIKPLTLKALQQESMAFSKEQSGKLHPFLFARSDGKVVGTYFEKLLDAELSKKFQFESGNSAGGIDYPELGVDVKVTSIKQPQSSSPFKSARQKVFGLGYHLLVFVYDRTDLPKTSSCEIDFVHTVFVDKSLTADYQTTVGIKNILDNDGNHDDLLAFFSDRNLPLDEIGANALAEEVIASPPKLGYLTISNALQWRLQYSRVIAEAGEVKGILKL